MFGATAVRQKREREKREKLGKPRKRINKAHLTHVLTFKQLF